MLVLLFCLNSVLDWWVSCGFVCAGSWVFFVVFILVFGECGVLFGIVWVVAINIEVRSSQLSSGRSKELAVPVLDIPIMILHQVWSWLFCGLHNDTWFPQFCILVLCVDMLICWQQCMLSLVQLVMTCLYLVSTLMQAVLNVFISWLLFGDQGSSHQLSSSAGDLR